MNTEQSSDTSLKIPTGVSSSFVGLGKFAVYVGAGAISATPASAYPGIYDHQPPRVVLKLGSKNNTIQETQSYLSDELMLECKSAVDDLLQTAGEPNWDGDGAEPVDAETVSVAKRLVNVLPGELAPPEISADPHGNVDFDWCLENGTLFTISIGKEGEVAMAGMRHDNPFLIRATERDGDASLPGMISYGIGWLQRMSAK